MRRARDERPAPLGPVTRCLVNGARRLVTFRVAEPNAVSLRPGDFVRVVPLPDMTAEQKAQVRASFPEGVVVWFAPAEGPRAVVPEDVPAELPRESVREAVAAVLAETPSRDPALRLAVVEEALAKASL